MSKINKHIHEKAKRKFTGWLLDGHFPEVGYEKTDFGHKYNMMEYSTTWAKFMKYADEKLKESGLDGIFQNARSKKFLEKITEVINSLEVEAMKNTDGRFKTWCD